MGKIRVIFLIICSVLLLSSCSYEPVELKEVSSLEIVKMNPDSISVKVGVILRNPNNYKITLTDPDLDLYINNNLIGKAIFEDKLVLEKDTTKLYVVPVSAGFNGKYTNLLISSLGGLLGGKMTVKGEGTVVGKAFLFKKTVPFEFEEEINPSL